MQSNLLDIKVYARVYIYIYMDPSTESRHHASLANEGAWKIERCEMSAVKSLWEKETLLSGGDNHE